MEDIILNDNQSALILEKDKSTGKYKLQLVLSEQKDGSIDEPSLFLSSVATKVLEDKNFLNDCIAWFQAYVESKTDNNTFH